MRYRVLLAADDPEIVTEFGALAEESGEITVEDTVSTAGRLVAVVATTEVDVIVLHEDLGPLPVLDLARELAARVPEVALVLLARDQPQALLAGALQSGFRGIVGLPLSLEDVQTTVVNAGVWARAVRAKLTGDEEEAEGGGTMLAFAGAKGGVGTTTLAVQLALLAATAVPRRRVCLVDLDLQSGDVRSFLDLTYRRSVLDLVEVAEELTARQLDESLYVHASGLRILLPPGEGEHGEEVSGDAARRILGGIRTRFDIVIVDLGTIVTEASAVAAEIADHAIVVTTPDVPAVRAANRLLGLWERLQVKKDGVSAVVNRVSRDSEIQPELVGRIVSAPLLRTSLPSDFRSVEAAANTGVPDRLEDGRLRRALAALAEELRLVAGRRRTPRISLRSSKGQAASETLGVTLLVGVVILLLWELALTGFTVVLGTHAAREAARELAVADLSNSELEETAAEDLPGGWSDDVEVAVRGDRVTVTLGVPIIVPGYWAPMRITSEAGVVREGP